MTGRLRGRPRAFDMEQALDEALDLFWSNGFEATALDDIALATGIARPSLAAAFGDKEAIYLKVLERFGLRMRAIFAGAFGRSAPLAERLRRFYLGAIDLYYSGEDGPRGCLAYCTATAAAAAHPAIRSALADMIARTDAAFEAVFKKARASGELPESADPARLAVEASATLQSIGIRARAGQERKSLERLARRAADDLCGKAA